MEERTTFFQKVSPLHLLCAGALFLLFLVSYIVQVNASSTKAYALRDAQIQHETLLRSQDRLRAEIDRLRSLSSVMERHVFLDLVPVEHIFYISHPESGAIALH